MEETPKQPGNGDDFQKIKGIGKSIADALHKLGIHCFSDLASYTPEHLAEMLKPHVAFISPQRIQRDNWLAQARLLSGKGKARRGAKKGNGCNGNGKKHPVVEEQREHWRELADFFVSFGMLRVPNQEERLITKVHYSQGDQQKQWEGIAGQKLMDWMIRQANLPAPPAPALESDGYTPSRATAELLQEGTIPLRLVDPWVSEVTPTGSRGPLTAALRLQARLELAKHNGDLQIPDPLQYSVEVYLVNLANNQSGLVANLPGEFQPGNDSENIESDFAIPNPGRYQLYVVARLLPPSAGVAYVQGPLIRVEP